MKPPASKIRILVLMAILCSCIGCDQTTKHMATKSLSQSPPQSYFGDTVRLGYALNPGGFLSAGSTFSPRSRFAVFVVFNSCVMVGLIAFLIKTWNSPLLVFVSLTLILAGGVGNLIDRVTNDGLVTDFLNIGVGAFRTGIFNVADVAVMTGALGLLIGVLKYPNSQLHPDSDSVESQVTIGKQD